MFALPHLRRTAAGRVMSSRLINEAKPKQEPAKAKAREFEAQICELYNFTDRDNKSFADCALEGWARSFASRWPGGLGGEFGDKALKNHWRINHEADGLGDDRSLRGPSVRLSGRFAVHPQGRTDPIAARGQGRIHRPQGRRGHRPENDDSFRAAWNGRRARRDREAQHRSSSSPDRYGSAPARSADSER